MPQAASINSENESQEIGATIMKTIIQNPSSKFLKVKCEKCKNEQVIFGKAATKQIECVVCGSVLATSTGGKTDVKAKILEVLG